MKFIKILALSAFLTSQFANAEMTCKNNMTELSISKLSTTGYVIKLTDLIKAKALLSLRQMFPENNEELLQNMLANAKDLNPEKTTFGACEKMDFCTVNSLSSEIPITCVKESEEVSVKFEIFRSENLLKAKCVSNGTFEVSDSSVEGTLTGEKTETLNFGFDSSECNLSN